MDSEQSQQDRQTPKDLLSETVDVEMMENSKRHKLETCEITAVHEMDGRDKESFRVQHMEDEEFTRSSNGSIDNKETSADVKCDINRISNTREHSSPNIRTSTPQQTPPLSPAKSIDDSISESKSSPASNSNLPKVRLNTLLASDPALMPDAKDLKLIQEEAKTQQRKSQLARSSPEQLDTLMITSTNNLIETSVLKPVAPSVEVPTRMKVFMCLPCGIGFSSPSTLEAHQAYYCSHRHKDMDDDTSLTAEKSSTSPSSGQATVSSTPSNQSSEPLAKALKTGKQYACTQCSYSADKKVSLNRHMRMHQTSPASTTNTSNNSSVVGGNGAGSQMEENSSQQIDRYCSDCDIRFNTVKTYRAHKQHYCSSRRNEGQLTPKLEVSNPASSSLAKPNISVTGTISPQNRTKTPTPAMVAAAAAAAAAALQQSPSTPFLALPTNPILIIPYSLIRSASLIAGPLTSPSPGVINPDTTCFTLDNGNLKPFATALSINAINAANANSIANSSAPPTPSAMDSAHHQQQLTNNNNESLLIEKKTKHNVEVNEEVVRRKEGPLRETAPLDLSLRRSPIAALLQRTRLHSASSAFLETEQQVDMESMLEAGKENLSLDEGGNITPEQIVCAPSLPNSPSMSPSPKRRTISPRSSGAGSNSSISPPVSTTSLNSINNPTNLLDNLQLRSMLPADLLNPLLAKQNLELALKLSAAAAAAVNSSSAAMPTSGSTTAELAAVAVAAAAGRSSLLGLPVLPSAAASTGGPASNQPQIYVKQGVSKCKECNIVFCKYENYLAHKQHYCSARNQETSDNDSKVSSTPPMGAAATSTETTTVAYQQLICAACGIKYTSLDNLRAHQNYYCSPKGTAAAAAVVAAAATDSNPISQAKEKCNKCKNIHEIGLPCPPPPALQQQQTLIPSSTTAGGNNQNVYKCPLCDAVSLTATESRKHIETHGTVKAFRCTICRYKGNTLRGMRTHVRMHFDKKTTDLNEEHYMSCILEDESIEIPSPASLNTEHLAQQQKHLQQAAAAAAVAAGFQQQQQQQGQQVFNCDICSYTSTYKGNVLRHMKLVHPHIVTNSPSMSPEDGDLEIADVGSVTSSVNGDNNVNSFAIKTEPIEHTTNPISSTPSIMLNPHDNNNSPLLNTGTTTNPNELMMPLIKSEPVEISTDPPNPTSPPNLRSPALGPPPPLNTTPEENINQKYCQTCDISFNYMKTYLAHKQFYCKSKLRRPETNDSPSPNAANLITSMPSPNSLPLLQKNKENMQQEAAI
uniref:Zinc finger protein ush n=1 Tax=Glossina brevipalpis TaxID=37001 RepID=A0A1A9WUM3_9MUSC